MSDNIQKNNNEPEEKEKSENRDVSAKIEELEKKLEQCQKESEERLLGWKRAKADLLNYKKEEEERLFRVSQFGQEMFIRELIVVLDSFELGFVSWQGDVPEKKGMALVRLQFEDILKKYGLEKIEVQKGMNFNPSEQECIMMIDLDDSHGTVVEEVEKGYRLNGKVIRPARVKVSK